MRITARQLRQIIKEELHRAHMAEKRAKEEEEELDEGGYMEDDLYESQRGNDENGQHDNDTDPGDPYARKLKESRFRRR